MFFQALLLSFLMDIGCINGGILNYHDNSYSLGLVDSLYVSLEMKAQYKFLYVGGGLDCYFTPITWKDFTVFQNTYIFKAGLDFGNVSFNYEHSCFHPMQPYATVFDYEIKPKYEGGYDRWYIRVQSK